MSASPADAAAPTAPRSERSDDLRRALLALTVLDDLDVHHDGETLTVPVPGIARRGDLLHLSSAVAADVLGGWPPASVEARTRLRSWFGAHRALAAAPHPGALLRDRVRALAVPDDSVWHPGPALAAWSRGRVPGGALEVGLGMVGIDEGGPPALLWPDLPAAAGMDEDALDELWASAREHAHRMGGLAAARIARTAPAPRRSRPAPHGRTVRPAQRSAHEPTARTTVLRPYGGCDVPTLLSTAALREELAGSDPVGMRAVSVPDRTRGWFDARHTDPAFVTAAWTATDPAARGFATPVLVTCDEVVHPR